MSDQADYHSHRIGERLIHIVDGDIETCEALSVLFRLEGFQTGYFLEAAQFVTALERWRPDAVVLNLRVGQDSGLALLSRIRGVQQGTPVVMLADGPQVEAAVTAMKLGATDVLSKPLDSDHLLMVVREALRRRRRGPPAPAAGAAQFCPADAARTRSAAVDHQRAIQQGSRTAAGHIAAHHSRYTGRG
jgi:Response regulator containing CheY-like receiver, AAA-type ATPase, and DNA-binding domains